MSAEPRESTSPSEYRAKNPYKPPPPEYKPPSILAEYKYLAVVFAMVLLGCVAFGWNALKHAPARRAAIATHSGGAKPQSAPIQDAARAAGPIYIEALPDKESR